jgi:hypothetical protein
MYKAAEIRTRYFPNTSSELYQLAGIVNPCSEHATGRMAGVVFQLRSDIFMSANKSGPIRLPSYPVKTRGSFLGGENGRGVKSTTHLHILPGLIICGDIPPLHHGMKLN